MNTPPVLSQGQRANFETLCRAMDDNNIALVSSRRKADQVPVALVCAMNFEEDGAICPVPIAVLCDGNPYEDYEDPTQ